MLKRKLIHTGLVSTLLVIIAMVTMAGTQLPATTTAQTLTDSSIQWLKFDPETLQLSKATEEDLLEAPAYPMHKQGVKFVNDYLARNSEILEKIKKRSSTPFAVIDGIFEKYKLPEELKYLAVVESELKHKAVSKVGAVGTWQLMAQTARELSLKVTPKYDERTHLYKSTVAAAKYLRDLHREFDNWLLVIAAYNSGPGKVYQAIKKSGSKNFWKMQRYLPAETRGHVKRYISTHYFFEGQGGLTTLTQEETAIYLKSVEEYNSRKMAAIAEADAEPE